MDPFFLFICEVMFERVDEVKEIVEHPMSPAGREPIPTFREAID